MEGDGLPFGAARLPTLQPATNSSGMDDASPTASTSLSSGGPVQLPWQAPARHMQMQVSAERDIQLQAQQLVQHVQATQRMQQQARTAQTSNTRDARSVAAPPVLPPPPQPQPARQPEMTDSRRRDIFFTLQMQLAPMLLALDQRLQIKLYAIVAYIVARNLTVIPMSMMLRLVDYIGFEAGDDDAERKAQLQLQCDQLDMVFKIFVVLQAKPTIARGTIALEFSHAGLGGLMVLKKILGPLVNNAREERQQTSRPAAQDSASRSQIGGPSTAPAQQAASSGQVMPSSGPNGATTATPPVDADARGTLPDCAPSNGLLDGALWESVCDLDDDNEADAGLAAPRDGGDSRLRPPITSTGPREALDRWRACRRRGQL